jgi:hypothetical protein
MSNFIDNLVASFNKLTMGTVNAINSIDTQCWAIVVLIIGCTMLAFCKHWNIDTTVAGGILGVASNMLTGQIKKAISDVKTNISTTEVKETKE